MFGEWRGHIWKNGNDVKVQRMEKGKFGFSLKMRPPPLPLHDTTFAETFLARKLFQFISNSDRHYPDLTT